MGPIILDTQVEAPLILLWNSFTKKSELTQWLCNYARINLKVGGTYQLLRDKKDFDLEDSQEYRITDFIPKVLLIFDWRAPKEFAPFMNSPPNTKVKMNFEAETEITSSIIIVHYGWGKGQEWEEAYFWHKKFWEDALEKLNSYLYKTILELY